MMMDRKKVISRIHRERRLEAYRKKSFQSLITTPADVSSAGVVLPEAANIAISFSAISALGQVIVNTSTGRSVSTPALAAGKLHNIGFFEKGVELIPAPSISGTITVYYLDDHRKPHIIASGVFA